MPTIRTDLPTLRAGISRRTHLARIRRRPLFHRVLRDPAEIIGQTQILRRTVLTHPGDKATRTRCCNADSTIWPGGPGRLPAQGHPADVLRDGVGRVLPASRCRYSGSANELRRAEHHAANFVEKEPRPQIAKVATRATRRRFHREHRYVSPVHGACSREAGSGRPFTADNASDLKPFPQPVSTGFPWIHAMRI
jgi:hypothetical protein